jgi:hypothetical protein
MKASAAVLFFVLTFPAFPQAAATDSPSAMPVLIEEIRQLRQALERAALLTPRITIVLQRVYVQQNLVSGLQSQLEGVRESIARTPPFDETGLRLSMEASIPAEQKKLIEEGIQRQKAQFEQERQAQREREVELSARLRTEEARLRELDARLDALDRLLGQPSGVSVP